MENKETTETTDLTVRPLVDIAVDENEKMIATLTGAKTQFCSLVADTPEQKALLYNAMNCPDYRLADVINMPLEITDLYAEIVDCTNTETGVVTKCTRIVLIDKDGIGYQAVSKGVFNAVCKLIAVYGSPHWDTPIVVTPYQITKGELKILSLKVGTAGKKSK